MGRLQSAVLDGRHFVVPITVGQAEAGLAQRLRLQRKAIAIDVVSGQLLGMLRWLPGEQVVHAPNVARGIGQTLHRHVKVAVTQHGAGVADLRAIGRRLLKILIAAELSFEHGERQMASNHP